MRTVFFGTPPIAIPALRALAETTELVGVVCQPDRPAGRGMQLAAPATKLEAQRLGVPVHQPVKVRTGNLHEWLGERAIDAVVVLAYGRILPLPVLQAPRLGCLNLHASLLPSYRGAAPIQWALIRGETETGISLMHMEEGLDTGPVYCERRLPIGPEETAGELTERLAALAALAVRQDLPRVAAGELRAVPQDDARATLAPPLTRDHCRIDWRLPARSVVDLVRGLAPKPGAFTVHAGKVLKIQRARVASERATQGAEPGTIVELGPDAIVVQTGEGLVGLLTAQAEGKRALSARELINGRLFRPGERLGT